MPSLSSKAISDWVQAITGIAIVIGLGLVIWELRQSRQIAQAQISSDSFALGATHNTSMLGEQAALVKAKACEEPQNLSTGEIEILQFHFRNRLALVNRWFVIEQRSGLYDGDWRTLGKPMFEEIFSTIPGRAWWRSASWEGEIKSFGDTILRDLGPPTCRTEYEIFREEVARDLEAPATPVQEEVLRSRKRIP